jgi:transcriptional regulator with XRE-family HTH domain
MSGLGPGSRRYTFDVRVSQDAVSDLLDVEDMTQVELAAALNTTQAAVSQWISGVRTPNESARTAIERASDARDAKAHVIDAGLDGTAGCLSNFNTGHLTNVKHLWRQVRGDDYAWVIPRITAKPQQP